MMSRQIFSNSNGSGAMVPYRAPIAGGTREVTARNGRDGSGPSYESFSDGHGPAVRSPQDFQTRFGGITINVAPGATVNFIINDAPIRGADGFNSAQHTMGQHPVQDNHHTHRTGLGHHLVHTTYQVHRTGLGHDSIPDPTFSRPFLDIAIELLTSGLGPVLSPEYFVYYGAATHEHPEGNWAFFPSSTNVAELPDIRDVRPSFVYNSDLDELYTIEAIVVKV